MSYQVVKTTINFYVWTYNRRSSDLVPNRWSCCNNGCFSVIITNSASMLQVDRKTMYLSLVILLINRLATEHFKIYEMSKHFQQVYQRLKKIHNGQTDFAKSVIKRLPQCNNLSLFYITVLIKYTVSLQYFLLILPNFFIDASIVQLSFKAKSTHLLSYNPGLFSCVLSPRFPPLPGTLQYPTPQHTWISLEPLHPVIFHELL